MPLDRRAARLAVAVEQLVHRLRVEPLGEGVGPGDVGDDDAHQAARAGLRGVRGGGRGGRRDRLGRRRGELRRLGEDRPLELAQPLPRLDAELLDQAAARVLVGLQRVRLAIAAVQREHELPAQALAVRVRGDQRLELADHLRVAPQRELGLDQQLVRSHPLVLQARDLALGEGLVGEVVERRAAPERERRFQRRDRPLGAAGGELAPPLRQPVLEPVRVEPLGLDPQLIAVLARDHHVARERLAQPRDADLERLRRAGRARVAPQLVDQPVAAERLVRVEQQEREERALAVPAERDRTTSVGGLERAEDAEVHGCTGRGGREAQRTGVGGCIRTATGVKPRRWMVRPVNDDAATESAAERTDPMPRLTRSLLAALAALFITVPVATASPDRGPVQTSSLAGTVSQPAAGDLRTADARDAATAPATPGSVDAAPPVHAHGRRRGPPEPRPGRARRRLVALRRPRGHRPRGPAARRQHGLRHARVQPRALRRLSRVRGRAPGPGARPPRHLSGGPVSSRRWPNGGRATGTCGRSVAAWVPSLVPFGHPSRSRSPSAAHCSPAPRRPPPRRATRRSSTRSRARTRSRATRRASGT